MAIAQPRLDRETRVLLGADLDPSSLAFTLARMKIRRQVWEATGYVPHQGQQRIHRAIDRGARFLYIVAGTRSGKTRGVSSEVITEMAFGPPPGANQRLVLVGAPEQDLTEKVFRWVWSGIVERGALGAAPARKSERERFIVMPWGARLDCKTTDNPQSMLGEGSVLTVLDEDARMRPDVYNQYVERNLMDYRGRAIRITTPRGRNNHAYHDYTSWTELALTNPLYFTTRFSSRDNPYLPEGEVDARRERLLKVGLADLYQQEYEADFVALEGLVYPQFNREFHVKHVAFMPGVPPLACFDWGFTNPFVALFFQKLPDDQFLVTDEIYETQLTDDEKASRVLQVVERIAARDGVEPRIQQGYGDPASPATIKLFRARGIPMYWPRHDKSRIKLNSVVDGIEIVRRILGRSDKPGLLVHPRCGKLIAEMENYAFADTQQAERPAKVADHTCDALRYGIVGSTEMARVPWGFEV